MLADNMTNVGVRILNRQTQRFTLRGYSLFPIYYTMVTWCISSGYFVASMPGVLGQIFVLSAYVMGIKIDTYSNIYVADGGNHRTL